ncbi:MAG: response regulator transcription factor, partial [Erysipelotrichaceae bacterium]
VPYVQALLRRRVNDEKEIKVIDIDDLQLNLEQCVLRISGKVVPLTSFEYKILRTLMGNPNNIFTKAQLYESTSDDYFDVYDNAMMVHISNLRSKIEKNPSDPQYIITVRGLGYKFKYEKE